MGFFKKALKGAGDWFSGKGGFSLMDDFKDWYDGTDAMKKQARLQDEYNMKYWNLQNAYNTPAMQMARFKEAGLNPNLIYGQTNTASAIGSNNVSSPESGSGVIGKAAQTIASIYGLKNMAANIANLHAQNSNIRSQNNLLQAQESFTRAQKDRYEYETNWLKSHDTTSFEDSRVRSVKGSLGQSSKEFAGFIGRKVGEVQGYFTPSGDVVMRPKNFASKEEFNREFERMLRQGRRVFVEY